MAVLWEEVWTMYLLQEGLALLRILERMALPGNCFLGERKVLLWNGSSEKYSQLRYCPFRSAGSTYVSCHIGCFCIHFTRVFWQYILLLLEQLGMHVPFWSSFSSSPLPLCVFFFLKEITWPPQCGKMGVWYHWLTHQGRVPTSVCVVVLLSGGYK